MEDLKKLPFVTLVDMLANHTERVMHLLKEGITGKDYDAGKAMIKLLTAEIERRNKKRERRTKR
ncbi:hypothetical protein MKQ70_13625 [Chitinophaga sedimenti]|uniref:hypothetical protein n=1 Tax=Chitinophaga sedimenti TaxID=2033606 RepID=UPI0020058B4C|nr:hypothetical protein [Chitinophaga sedimenti]MCK7556005.1 hypothetical protein [Chitinophaga sedimenti]